jgi:hypothetical protein
VDRLAGLAARRCYTPGQRDHLQVETAMNYHVSYEHSLKTQPDEFIVHVPSQLVEDVPANVPRALLPEYITDLILKRSPRIGKIRNMRIL